MGYFIDLKGRKNKTEEAVRGMARERKNSMKKGLRHNKDSVCETDTHVRCTCTHTLIDSLRLCEHIAPAS